MSDESHYLYGLHTVLAAIENPFRVIHTLFINQERSDKRMSSLLSKAESANISVKNMSIQAMNQQFPNVTHQGVAALVSKPPNYVEADLLRLLEINSENLLILILDGVTDPHNLGACLRSADAAGVSFVIIPKDNSASVTAVVSKVACGATESIPLIRVTNLARTLNRLKKAGVWLYGAAGESETSLYELDFRGPVGLILGAEGAGLRRLTRECCDELFSIPMRGSVSSLNVSVATGVCLYEILRQRSNTRMS